MEAIAIGMSHGVSMANFVERKLDYFLGGVEGFSLVGVNDSNNIVKTYAENRKIEYKSKKCTGRIDAKQIVSKVGKLLLFWSGRDLSDLLFCASNLRVPYRIVPVPVTTIVNKDEEQEFDLYIGRGSPWGNPFSIKPGTSDTRDVVIEKYRAYFNTEILTNPDKHSQLIALQGLRLGCHCKPLSCHGDIIVSYLNKYFDEQGS